MKKRFLSVISAITAFLMSVVALSGCTLITKDSEREMNTVVATVDIVKEENVYKKDMIMAYLNYGYYYVQYQGYTQERVLNLILDNLVNNRILVQNALKENGKNTVEECLNDEQKTEAKYNAYKAINDLLDGYEVAEDEKKADTLTETVRTVPTGATNAEDKITIEKKREYIEKGFDVDSTAERRDALTKTVKLFKDNGLLGDKYDGKDLTKTTYYENVYKSYCESELLEAYEKKITDEARKITLVELESEWAKKVNTQKDWSKEEFESALSSASATDPIVYSAYGKYGYVYNLLLGVSEEQEAAIAKIKEDEPNISEKDYATKRNDILKGTIVKDLRSTWITSGYDFDGTKFTGDYTFTKPENSFSFKGTVKELKAKTEDESAQYSVTNVHEYGLDEFIKVMEEYVYGVTQTATTSSDDSIYRTVNTSTALDQYSERINELLFAFSTDPGSLNTWKGYNVKPAVDGSNSEEYVTTFANAARELIEMDNKSYIIVASDYGYHVLFYSEIYDANVTKYATLEDYLNTLNIDKGSKSWGDYLNEMLTVWEDFEDTDNFLYTFVNSLTSTKVSNALSEKENGVINEYRYEKGSVKIYEKRYKDLLG